MSLFDAAERFAALDRSQIALDTKRCLHSQGQGSGCEACFHLCPVDAITSGKPPVLDAELCQSCLACLPACPTGAYGGHDDVADLLNCAAHVEDQAVEILCGLHPHPEAGVEDAIGIQIHGCLAGLGMGAYLTLSTLVLSRILPRIDACRSCKWASLHPQIRQQVQQANLLLSLWNRTESVTCIDEADPVVERPVWNAKNPPLSRRDLFRMMARQGQIAMARAMENGVAAAEHKPGRDRLRMLVAVSHLPESVSAQEEVLNDLSFATLTVSEACTACGACGKACPTGALDFTKNEDEMTFSLSCSAQNCIGCDLCDHVCMPDAIQIDHAPVFKEVFGRKEPMVLAAGEMVRCERCRSWIAKRDGVKLCSLCEFRRTHPFGSMIPRKAVKESRS